MRERSLRMERLEPRLALSATAAEMDCGCGRNLGFADEMNPTAESDVPLAVATALRAESFDTAGLSLQTFTGELTVYALDFKDGSYRTDYYLKDESGSTQLVFAGDIPEDLRTGNQVEVVGYYVGSSLIVDSFSTIEVSPLRDDDVAAAILNRPTVVIIANFLDSSVTCTQSELEQTLFTGPDSVAAFFEEASWGNVSFEGTVLAPVTIPFNSTGSCNFFQWGLAARQAATDAYGTDFSSNPNIIYVHPAAPNCGVTGVSSIGGNDTWNFGACDDKFTFAHELGHNLGFTHANTPTMEGGDGSSVMGLLGTYVHFNVWEKILAGWFSDESRAVFMENEGVYTLNPIESAAGTDYLTLIYTKGDTSETYYVSYRSPIGFDSTLDPQFRNAVTIHSASFSGSSILRGTIADGELYSDPVNGFFVKMLSHTADTAVVSVTFTPPVEESADFDGDGDVDGRDFLKWQRGGSPTPLGSGDLTLWQEEYGEEGSGIGGQRSGISDLGLMIDDVRSEGSGVGEDKPEINALPELAPLVPAYKAGGGTQVFADEYIGEVDRAFEQLSTVPRTQVHSFGEMVARRQMRRAALVDFAF